MNQIDLSGRTAVVTGGAGGLGLAVAERLLMSGAQVSLWGRNIESLRAGAAKLAPCDVQIREVDVTDHRQVATAVESTRREMGSLDILVNNAGTGGYVSAASDYPLEEWDRQLASNLSSVFYCCRAAIPAMRERGWGRIVNVASIAGKDGNAMQAGYAASKAGVIALTKSLGKELAATGVLVNAVAPTMFDSPMSRKTRASMPPALLDKLLGSIPMGRLGKAEELAAMIAWICSDQCSFVTGFTFDFSGGRVTY